MSVTVLVNPGSNGLTLCHKGSNGISQATLPDVCKTPTPGGPVPMPYPNIAFSSDLAKGTTTVHADGGNMCANYGSEFSKSTGDEPGTIGGVKSGTFIKEATWISFSFDVKLEGKGACRLSDKMFHNHENTVNAAGEVQAPLSGDDLKKRLLQCDEAKKRYEEAKKANGGKDPEISTEPSNIKSGGDTDMNTGKIRIDVTDNNGTAIDDCIQVEVLCFELANLSRKAEFKTIFGALTSSTRDEFIKGIEKIEYENVMSTLEITNKCKEAWGCPKMKSYYEPFKNCKNFDEYYKVVSPAHKESYGKVWDVYNPPKK